MKSTLGKCQRECGFSDMEWANFMKTIRDYSLDPVNYIGLEGFKVHKQDWEDWLDVFLDTQIGKQYWGILKGKKWIYGRDREVIRKLFRSVVILTVNSLKRKRGSNRLSASEVSLEEGVGRGVKESQEGGEYHQGRGEEKGEEGEEGGEQWEEYNEYYKAKGEDNAFSPSYAGSRRIYTNSGSPRSKETGGKEALIKNSGAKRLKRKPTGADGDDDSDYRPSHTLPKSSKENRVSMRGFSRRSHDPGLPSTDRVDKPAATKETPSQIEPLQVIYRKDGWEVDTASISPVTNMHHPTPTESTSEPPLTTQRPPLIFRTRVTTTTKHLEIDYKFVYTENTPSLPIFLERVHRKHKLGKEQKISSLQVQVGDKKYRIDHDDPERHWDWHVAMGLLKDNKGPIEIALDIS